MKTDGVFAVLGLVDGQTVLCMVVVGVPNNQQCCKGCGCRRIIHSEVEVVGDEVFRAPRWSTGFLHLHFSVAGGNEYVGDDRRLYYESRERKQSTDRKATWQ